MTQTVRRLAYGTAFTIILFSNVLGRIIPYFNYLDEGLTLLCGLYLLWHYIQSRKIERQDLVIFLCAGVMLLTALLGNIVFQYQHNLIAIFKDAIALMKMPIAILAGLAAVSKADDEPLNVATKLSKVYISVLFACAVLSLFADIGLSYGIRHGIRTYTFLFTHPTFLVYSVVLMVLTILAKGPNKSDCFNLLEAVVVLILTMRDKGFAFVVMLTAVLFFLRGDRKVKPWHLAVAAGAALILSLGKILDYFTWTWSARMAMHEVGFKLMLASFPLGSGLATFGNSISGEYYSDIYALYGLSEKPGLNPLDYVNLSDAQWPYYMGQFGVIGLIAFLAMLFFLFRRILKCYNNDTWKTKAIYLIGGYLLMASLVETVFTNESGVTFAIVIFMFLGGNNDRLVPCDELEPLIDNIWNKIREKFMRLFKYLKENGARRAAQVFYQYKLHKILCAVMLPVLKHFPLRNIIMIESHNDFDCNGGAFYDYLIENGYNKQYKIVWLLKNKCNQKLPKNVTTVSLHKPSLRKAYYHCVAKCFTTDNDITPKLRSEQVSLFCDHGAVALKSVRGLYKIPDSVDYMLCPSPFYKPIIASEFSVPADDKRFVCVGYPFHDIFYLETGNELEKITKKKYSKVFLWMPTFRKGGGFRRNDSSAEQPFGVPLIETEQMLKKLQHFLEETDSLLIIKIHPMQDPDTLKQLHGSDNICILTGTTVKELGIDNYRLVKHADALISDYSSIAFSYMLLDRPVGFVLSDLEDYKLGFAMKNPEDFLTGNKIYTFDDFFKFLQEVINGVDSYQEERRQLVEKLFTPRDSNSCERIATLLRLDKE